MNATASKNILRRIRQRGRGGVFTTSDFLNAAPRATVDQTLSRLARQGIIRRLVRGIYDYPRTHELIGLLSPNIDAVAGAIARRDQIRIQTSGESAANSLGLSTQVPAKSIYLTDGRSRTLRIGNQEIELRHVPPSRLIFTPGIATLTTNALRYLGRKRAGDENIQRVLRKTLESKDKSRLAKSLRHMPTWLQPIARSISESNPE